MSNPANWQLAFYIVSVSTTASIVSMLVLSWCMAKPLARLLMSLTLIRLSVIVIGLVVWAYALFALVGAPLYIENHLDLPDHCCGVGSALVIEFFGAASAAFVLALRVFMETRRINRLQESSFELTGGVN